MKGYDELKKLLFGVVDIGTSSLEYRNNDDAMIKSVLSAPVGTKIFLQSRALGSSGKVYYEVTERGGNDKMLRPVDENGNRTQYQEVKLSRANVKKFLSSPNTGYSTGTVTLTLPESVLKNLPKAEKKVFVDNEGVKANESRE